MAHIKSRIPCPRQPEYAVQISLVIDAESSRFMNDIYKLTDPVVIDPCIFRIGDHERRRTFGDGCFQRRKIRQAVLIRIQGVHLIPQSRRRSRIRRMRENGRNDLVPLVCLPLLLKICPDRLHICEDRLAPSRWLQADLVHTGDCLQILRILIHNLQDSLYSALILTGMQFLELLRAHQLLMDLGAVLHGTGPKSDIDVNVRSDGFLG